MKEVMKSMINNWKI